MLVDVRRTKKISFTACGYQDTMRQSAQLSKFVVVLSKTLLSGLTAIVLTEKVCDFLGRIPEKI